MIRLFSTLFAKLCLITEHISPARVEPAAIERKPLLFALSNESDDAKNPEKIPLENRKWSLAEKYVRIETVMLLLTNLLKRLLFFTVLYVFCIVMTPHLSRTKR
jgi:hypothetical protein